MRLKLLVLFYVVYFSISAYSQCGPGTPTFNVNLTGSPTAVWTSPSIIRNDNCCGTSAPDKCIKFVITLDPAAVGISFNIISGAVPSGALYYQIGCGPPQLVGKPICLSGPGPHILTFCKPGNNQNIYQISSIPPATAGNNITVDKGCSQTLHATGFDSTTVTWTSIFPGATGTYNSYLSCTSGCLNPIVTGSGTPPPYVDYLVCGQPAAQCNFQTVCDTVRVTFNPPITVTIIPTLPTICFGQTSITLTANGSGGTPPYTYLWNNINTAQSINVGAGTYYVTLSDASGCPAASASVTVTSFSVAITANAGPDDTVCIQNPVAVLNGSVTGASGGIWSGGGGLFSPNNTTLSGVSYTPTPGEITNGSVTLMLITTGNGTCPPDTDFVTIYFMGFTGVVSAVPVNVSCYGGNNGSATVSVTGGISPYTYFWNTVPAQTSSTATGLTAGTYSVILTNGIGCTLQTSVTITQPPPLAVNSTITNVTCFGGNDGTISVSPAGGTPAYTYAWSPGGQTTTSVSNLSAGSYTLTVTDSKNCQFIATYTITQSPPLAIALSPTNVNCFNGNNGSVGSTVTGGTSPYSYNWIPVSATSPNVSGLYAGTYTLIITDSKGCTKTAVVSITQPTALSATVTTTNETCSYSNNGTATVTVTGGSPGYSYTWQPGGQTTSVVSNLPAGTYTLTVTDTKACNTTTFVTITQPSPLTINFINQTNVSCFGGANGSVTGNVTGGTAGYTYLWNPGGQTTVSASNLPAGTYTLTATDSKGCTVQSTITITQPAVPLTVTASALPVSCGGGSNGILTASASGGTASYTYNWQPGNYTGPNISNVTAGTYTVTATDANGCTSTRTVVVTQPSLINLTTSSTNAACNTANGQSSVTVSGGVSPYSYSWVPTGQTTSSATGLFAGSYTVIVTDANGCTASAVGNINNNLGPTASVVATTSVTCYGGSNGSATATASGGTLPYTYAWNTSPAQSTATVTGLPAGNYIVTVTDGTGCQAFAMTGPISQPSQLILTVATGSVSCFGGNGSASASATGGTPGYTYTWWPSGNTGSTITGLIASTTYTAQVTDGNSCVQTATFVINQPVPLTTTIIPFTNVSCFGGSNGSATASVSGGTPFYSYSWAPAGGNGPTASGLTAGTYTVSVMDANGCTQSSTVTITQPAQPLTATGSTLPVSCFGGGNGTATVSPSGGTPGYSYQWSPSGGTNQTASGLTSGTYNVIVTDANGCQTNASVVLSQPSAISGTLLPVNPSCGLSNGSIASQISGGTGPYSYVWNPGSSTGSSISGVGPGSYTLQVTDAANCTATYTVTLINIPGPSVSLPSVTHVSCYGGNNGSATVIVTQGTPPYTINWLPYGGNSTSAGFLIAGTYTVKVTDALGCSSSMVVTVTQPPPVSVATYTVIPVSCYSGNNGSAIVSVSGGTPPYTYSWSNGQTTSAATNLNAGFYTVTVWDQKNCSASITINVGQPSAPISSSIMTFNPSCYGGYGISTITPSGGTIPYSYTWSTSPIQTGSTATNLGAGTYTVITTDANGCTRVDNVTITQPAQVITIAGPNVIVCAGKPTTLTAGALGGSGSYYYAWQPPSVINSGTLTVTPSTTTSYIVVAYDLNGCAGKPDTVIASVYSMSPANVQAVAYSPICPGQSSVVYVQVSGNPGPVTYAWNNGLGPGPGGFNIIPTQSPTTYIVTVTNSCGVSVTDSVQVFLNPPPTVSLTSDTNVSCAPAFIHFYDNSVSGNPLDPITSWYWNFGDGNYSSLANPTHIYSQPGTYVVFLTVTTTGGCANGNGSTPLLINVIPSPIASFTTNPSVTPMNTQTINFINQTSGAISYFWDFGDGSTSTAMNPQHRFPTIGFYTVTLITTNQYGCTDTFRILTRGEGDIVFPNAFTPNPNGPTGGGYHPFNLNNDVFFPFASGIDEFHMMIFNRWGELIFETFDIKIGWDGYYRGKLCQQDVYVWKAYAKFIDDRTVNKVGDVTLLR